MKLYGNRRGEPEELLEEETLPVPKDKSIHHRVRAVALDDWDDDEEELEDEDEEEEDEEEGRGWSRWVLIGLVILLVGVLVGGGFFVNHMLDLINYQDANSNYFATVSNPEDLPEETPVSSYLAQLEAAENAKKLEATEEELAQWDQQIEEVVSDDSTYVVPITDDVYNILLIGSDTRESGTVGRSDAMIILSLNQKTHEIYLTSFLRDCYVSIPGYGNTRLNHAFAYGGPDLLEETLESNFKVHIDKYIMVDFFSFMDVIDILGGVYINISDEEAEITNDYIWSMNKLMGEDSTADYIWYTGYRLLNGKQALCYARNRYTGNDYARTERQRNIINQILIAAQKSSASTLVDLAQAVLPHVTTDLTKSEILNYAANIAAYADYDIIQQQIPAEGTYSGATISGMSVISLDLDSNIEILQKTIYADEPTADDADEDTEE